MILFYLLLWSRVSLLSRLIYDHLRPRWIFLHNVVSTILMKITSLTLKGLADLDPQPPSFDLFLKQILLFQQQPLGPSSLRGEDLLYPSSTYPQVPPY